MITRIDKVFNDVEEMIKQINKKNKEPLEAEFLKHIREINSFAQKKICANEKS